MKELRILATATMIVIAAQSMGCARAPDAVRVRYADLGQGGPAVRFDRPIILEFHEGERLPVELHFAGEAFEMSPEHPAIELVAKQTFYGRIDQGGIYTSLDGTYFTAHPKAPGRFKIGLAASPASSPKLVVEIETPRHGGS